MAHLRPAKPVRLTDRQVYLRTLMGAIESLSTGATTIVGYRWFSHAEILAREAHETFLPPGLGGLLGDVLALPRSPTCGVRVVPATQTPHVVVV